MCSECSPGGRLLMSSLIFTPCGASESTAVPTVCPCAFLISTVTGLGAAELWACAAVVAAQRKHKHARLAIIFIVPRFARWANAPDPPELHSLQYWSKTRSETCCSHSGTTQARGGCSPSPCIFPLACGFGTEWGAEASYGC